MKRPVWFFSRSGGTFVDRVIVWITRKYPREEELGDQFNVEQVAINDWQQDTG